jgi:hypothetical protein
MIESTFAVGRRFRCTMRVDCGQLDPGAVIQPIRGEWHPHIPAINGRFAVDSLLEEARFEPSVPLWLGAFTRSKTSMSGPVGVGVASDAWTPAQAVTNWNGRNLNDC